MSFSKWPVSIAKCASGLGAWSRSATRPAGCDAATSEPFQILGGARRVTLVGPGCGKTGRGAELGRRMADRQAAVATTRRSGWPTPRTGETAFIFTTPSAGRYNLGSNEPGPNSICARPTGLLLNAHGCRRTS